MVCLFTLDAPNSKALNFETERKYHVEIFYCNLN